MDNMITGTNDVESAKEFYHITKRIFQDASMNMREWNSNDNEVLKTIVEKDQAKEEVVVVVVVVVFIFR